MENLEQATSSNKEKKSAQKVVVLRWGHRPQRDARLTSHVALTARALGASGFFLSDIVDKKLQETVAKIADNWGGEFLFEMGKTWKSIVRDWKTKGGVVVHLTAYGENIQTSPVLDRIKQSEKNVLVIVGSQKVPKDFFSDSAECKIKEMVKSIGQSNPGTDKPSTYENAFEVVT